MVLCKHIIENSSLHIIGHSKFYFNQYAEIRNCYHVKPSLTIPASLAGIMIVAYSFKEHIQNNLRMSKNTVTITTSALISFVRNLPSPRLFPWFIYFSSFLTSISVPLFLTICLGRLPDYTPQAIAASSRYPQKATCSVKHSNCDLLQISISPIYIKLFYFFPPQGPHSIHQKFIINQFNKVS